MPIVPPRMDIPGPSEPIDELSDADYVSTRFLSRTLELEGVKFSWWAIDEAPSFVTVSSQLFGSKSGFTRDDPEAFASQMAEKLLRAHYEAPADSGEQGP